MKRRSFLSTAASILSVAVPLVTAVLGQFNRPWPFVKIDWITLHDDPSLVGWDAIKDLASCDCCYATATDDFGNGLSEPRTFYRTTDGYDLIVCEQCAEQYVAENCVEASK